MVCKFWVDPLTFASNYGFSPRELNLIRQHVEDNRDKILEAWHEHCG
jgi:Domain of unknown function (DUF4160)